MSDQMRLPTKTQVSKELPGLNAYIIGNDETSGQAKLLETRPIQWKSLDDDNVGMSIAYTTKFPADLCNNADIEAHTLRIQNSSGALPVEGGTMLGYLDVAPGHTCRMHRTQTIDYAILLEGEMQGVLDSGEMIPMRRGDVMIQRATMHAWQNSSQTSWARMVLCLQECQPIMMKNEQDRQ